MKKVLLVLAMLALVSPAFGAQLQVFLSDSATLPTSAPGDVPYISQQNSTVTLYVYVKANVDPIGAIALDFDVTGGTNVSFTANDINYGGVSTEDPEYWQYVTTDVGSGGLGLSPTEWDVHAWDVTDLGVWEVRAQDPTDSSSLIGDGVPGPDTEPGPPVLSYSNTMIGALTDVDTITLIGFGAGDPAIEFPYLGGDPPYHPNVRSGAPGLRADAIAPDGIYFLGTLTYDVTTSPHSVDILTAVTATTALGAAATIEYGPSGDTVCTGDPESTPLGDASAEASGSTIMGDFNGDGFVTASDIGGFQQCLVSVANWDAANPGKSGLVLGDFNSDGFVTASDIGGFQGALVTGGTPLP